MNTSSSHALMRCINKYNGEDNRGNHDESGKSTNVSEKKSSPPPAELTSSSYPSFHHFITATLLSVPRTTTASLNSFDTYATLRLSPKQARKAMSNSAAPPPTTEGELQIKQHLPTHVHINPARTRLLDALCSIFRSFPTEASANPALIICQGESGRVTKH